MSTIDRFDPFERRIGAALEEIAATRLPDYLDDVLRRTASTSQRPRWTFPERWLPVDTALPRPRTAARLSLRWIALAAVILILAAVAAVALVGSRHRVPPPFGLAGNGSIAYTSGGDLFVRDSASSAPRLLVGGPGFDAYPFYSPDGDYVGFSTTVGADEYLKVARADGTGVRQLLPDPIVNAGATWRPDSRALAVDTVLHGQRRLLIVPVDGSPVTELDLGGLEPDNVSWRPPDGKELLFRSVDAAGKADLYVVGADGTGLRALHQRGVTTYGPDWTLTGAGWSPDGGTIAYNAHVTVGAAERFRVRLIAADGTAERTAPGPGAAIIQEGWPLYSPDGRWILVHRWSFKADVAGAQGWVAVMPADGSAPARDIGPKIDGGEDTGLAKTWSPDGTRVLVLAANTHQVFSIDPVTGASELLDWAKDLPDWQRVAR